MNGLSAPQCSFWPENGKHCHGTEGTASEVTGSCKQQPVMLLFPTGTALKAAGLGAE